MKRKQDFAIGRSEGKRVRFMVSGAAGATEAAWYAGPLPSSSPDEQLVRYVVPQTGIEMTDIGQDLQVDITLVPSVTEGFKVGPMHHELWATVNGFPERKAIGTMTVDDTLRN